MKNGYGWWPLIIFAIGLVGVILYLLYLVKSSDEIQSKREWSILQSLELKYRDRPLQDGVFVDQIDEFTAAAIRSDDGKTRVWVLLNPKHEPLIKHLPNMAFTLTPDELHQLESSYEIKPIVREYLSTQSKKSLRIPSLPAIEGE
jgi:hypothetical protein